MRSKYDPYSPVLIHQRSHANSQSFVLFHNHRLSEANVIQARWRFLLRQRRGDLRHRLQSQHARKKRRSLINVIPQVGVTLMRELRVCDQLYTWSKLTNILEKAPQGQFFSRGL